jgi:hypothetical protein
MRPLAADFYLEHQLGGNHLPAVRDGARREGWGTRQKRAHQ